MYHPLQGVSPFPFPDLKVYFEQFKATGGCFGHKKEWCYEKFIPNAPEKGKGWYPYNHINIKDNIWDLMAKGFHLEWEKKKYSWCPDFIFLISCCVSTPIFLLTKEISWKTHPHFFFCLLKKLTLSGPYHPAL